MTSSWTDWSIATFRWETDYKRLKIVQPWSQQVGYLIVDHEETPELLQVVFKTLRTLDKLGNHIHPQDKHWDECIPKEIPYTIAAEKYKKKEFEGSAQVDRLRNELIIMWKNFHTKKTFQATLDIKEADKEYSYMYHTRCVDHADTFFPHLATFYHDLIKIDQFWSKYLLRGFPAREVPRIVT